MKSLLKLALIGAAVAVPASVLAQENSKLLTVDIIATHSGQEAAIQDVAPSVHVITREEIERAQADDVADLLLAIPGIDVVRSGGPGAPIGVFTRGTDSNHTLFLVDGVRYTTETFLNAQIQNLAPEMIERIEVVKGPRSALYGSDAIGGVVNIITRRAQTGVHGGGSVRVGDYGTRDVSAFFSAAGKNADVAVNLEHQHFDGFPPRTTGVEALGHENFNGNIKAGVNLGDARVAVRHLQGEGNNDYDSFGSKASQDFENRVSALEFTTPVVGSWRTKLVGSLAYDDITQKQPDDPARPNNFSYTRVDRKSLEWENTVQFGSTRWVGGLSTSSSEIDSVFFSSPCPPFSCTDTVTQDRTERHAIYTQLDGAIKGISWLGALRGVSHDQFNEHVIGNLEFNVPVWAGAHIGLLGGTAYKEPELTDLYGIFGNPNLQPERSRSYEVNLKQALGERVALTTALFHTSITNAIAGFPPINIARARIQGVEAGVNYRDARWSAGLSGSVQDPINKDTGRRLPRRSGKSLRADVGANIGPVRLGVEARAQGHREEFTGAQMAGYCIYNATASWNVWKGISIGVRGENLTDVQYTDVVGFRAADRSGYVTLRAAF